VIPLVFLNDLLHVPVYDSQGQRIGTLTDLVVSTQEAFPVVTGVVVSLRKGLLPFGQGNVRIIPWRQINSLEGPRITTSVPAQSLESYTPRDGEIFLARDVLDKQIVDIEGKRIVRVNDLKLTQVRGVARLLGADISGQAFLRRLLPFRFSEQLVSWNYVAPLGTTLDKVRLKVPYTKLASLHPADLADLIEQMAPETAADTLESMDVETAADALQEVEDAYQADIVEEMETSKAADVLEAMPADEAADIVADLSTERAQEILAEMQPEEAAEVKELLQYEEDSAGGRMTSEVIALSQDLTAAQAIEYLRNLAPDAETPYYLFVVDKEDHLLGNVSLRHLVTAPPEKPLSQIMDTRVIKVDVHTDQEEVARIMDKYHLLAVPVVDGQNHLRGMITVNDIVDVIHEETTEDMAQMLGTTPGDVQHEVPSWLAALGRVSWLSAAILGGAMAAVILRTYGEALASFLPLAYFLPLLLAVSSGFVAQSLAAAGTGLAVEGRPPWLVVGREAGLGLLVGLVTGIAVAAGVSWWMSSRVLGLALGISLAITLPLAGALGAFLPILLRRLGTDPSWASSAVLGPAVGVVSILVYLSLATWLINRST